jgi:predicted transglutaminase-like cysteine proteinase
MSFRKTSFIIAALFILLSPNTTTSQELNAEPMSVRGAAKPPIGYVQFCRDFPAECARQGSANLRIALNEASWARLDGINREVNTRIAPLTDAENYGVAERWVLPQTAGDCEDYVLLKRKLLIEAGLPASALLITVVRDQRGDGHAVLTAVTDQGDLILDNQEERILPWQATPYRYVKRQSRADQTAWVMLGDTAASPRVATTRPRR